MCFFLHAPRARERNYRLFLMTNVARIYIPILLCARACFAKVHNSGRRVEILSDGDGEAINQPDKEKRRVCMYVYV